MERHKAKFEVGQYVRYTSPLKSDEQVYQIAHIHDPVDTGGVYSYGIARAGRVVLNVAESSLTLADYQDNFIQPSYQQNVRYYEPAPRVSDLTVREFVTITCMPKCLDDAWESAISSAPRLNEANPDDVERVFKWALRQACTYADLYIKQRKDE